MNILILGATGMLGNAMLRLLASDPALSVSGTARSFLDEQLLPETLRSRIHRILDAANHDEMVTLFRQVRPQVVVNCIGLVKQVASADDPLMALKINALLPHRLSQLCSMIGARLVHISTDCVFAGTTGRYSERNVPDPVDLYGRTKLLGELTTDAHAVTLRTSIIGHELRTSHGLVSWFLAQRGSVRGFEKAVFSGLPTVELACVIRDHILPRPDLWGLYHVSAAPISKLSLLRLIAREYGRGTIIEPDDELVIDRSLDSSRFYAATGYRAPAWDELVRRMHVFN